MRTLYKGSLQLSTLEVRPREETGQGVTHKQIVTYATGHLPQSIGIKRSHQHEVCPPPQFNVENWVRSVFPHLAEKEIGSLGWPLSQCGGRKCGGGGPQPRALSQELKGDHLSYPCPNPLPFPLTAKLVSIGCGVNSLRETRPEETNAPCLSELFPLWFGFQEN